MMIFGPGPGPSDAPSRFILLFGVGLVGSAIAQKLQRAGLLSVHVPYPWDLGSDSENHLASIQSAILNWRGGEARPPKLDVVWAAGTAGFGAQEGATALELAAFSRVLRLAKELSGRVAAASLHFHLVSSAGGLFEGKVLVDARSTPSPRRPYGELKLAQEAALLASDGFAGRSIYRPSSIYGYLSRNHRLGLVATLVRNIARHEVTRLAAGPSTLRDYVFLDDVAAYLAHRLLRQARDSETVLLANGKPSSIGEIVGLIERRLERRAYVQFTPAGDNDAHTTFLPAASPEGFSPTELTVGVEDLIRRVGLVETAANHQVTPGRGSRT